MAASPPAEAELGGPAVIVEKADSIAVDDLAAATPNTVGASSAASASLDGKKVDSAAEKSSESASTQNEGVGLPSYDPLSLMVMDQNVGTMEWAPEDALKDIEQVTSNVQELGRNVVDIASTASKEAAAAVQELSSKMPGLTGLSSTLSSWWSSFDMGEKAYQDHEKAVLVPQISGSEETGVEAPLDKKSVNLQALFGLPAQESLIEAFPCKLLQTFRCTHNSFTPELPMSFPGTLYITDKNVCFHVSDKNQRISIALEHSKLKNISRQKARRAEKSDTLKLHMTADQWVAVHEFVGPEDIESALALLEHLST